MSQIKMNECHGKDLVFLPICYAAFIPRSTGLHFKDAALTQISSHSTDFHIAQLQQ